MWTCQSGWQIKWIEWKDSWTLSIIEYIQSVDELFVEIGSEYETEYGEDDVEGV